MLPVKIDSMFCLAWINNCVGMENLRFFVLFLFYLLIGMLFMIISICTMWHHPLYVSVYYSDFIIVDDC